VILSVRNCNEDWIMRGSEADEPSTILDLLDAEPLASQHGGEVDPLAMPVEAPRKR
jgi:hypothetical protein